MNGAGRSRSAEDWCGCRRTELGEFLEQLRTKVLRNGRFPIILREDVRHSFRRFVTKYPKEERRRLRRTLGGRIRQTEEVIFRDADACVVLREQPGDRQAWFVQSGRERLTLLDERQLLSLRESILLGRPVSEHFIFGIDFRPYRVIPEEAGTTQDIGNGPWRVGRLLAQGIRTNPQEFLRGFLTFLEGRSAGDRPLFFTRPPVDVAGLRIQLHRALALLAGHPAQEEISRILPALELLGFASGWGRTSGRARDTLELLQRLITDPDADSFLELFARLPLVRRVLLASVHGWFAQNGVLGRPDTGGQIVYVLDQARALEARLRSLWHDAGVDIEPQILILSRLIPEAEGTACDVPREKVRGSKNAWILRVPFRYPDGSVHPQWLSRFQVWPYLERYARDAYKEVTRELGGAAPDLVIGNYTDGNTVAAMLGREWGVPTSVIAHALEKNKYLMSDLYWRDLEPDYHFSIHFLSDILAANSADFIMTSTYQEIAGTTKELGQYESYEIFTLPERYRVLNGVNIRSARFAINPPGVDTKVYHPYPEIRRQDRAVEHDIEQLVFGDVPDELGIRGQLTDPEKPLIFTMARLDKIKNLTGLLNVYGRRPALREAANLLIVSGSTELAESSDHEEREQIRRMHALYDQHDLWHLVRWLPSKLGQGQFPHYYRFVARRRGVFIQPALFEAFGLTVLEAMASGLPVVATQFGGPATVIESGVSGFLVDPNHGPDVEKAILTILTGATADGGDLWSAISRASVRRVHDHFSWQGHARRVVTNYGLYGLWNHVSPKLRQVRQSYVSAVHHLLFSRLIHETWPELTD